jgi:anaerobic sulfite reductase subunit B
MLQLTPQTIRIVDFYDDGTDAKHFTFEPKDFVHDKPINIGQFFMLTLPGAGLAPFTYTSIPDKAGRFNALIRNVGHLTEKLFSLGKGDVLGYNGPFGRGWPVGLIKHKEVLIVAGGCGLAPVASTIDYLINNEYSKSVTLLYATRDSASQVLKKERSRWSSSIKLVETLEVGGDCDHSGLPTQYLSHLLNKDDRYPDIVLTCGPEAMMMAVANSCVDFGIKTSDIWMSIERRMRCGVGLCGHCYVANSYACMQGPTYRYDEFMALENKTVAFEKDQHLFQYC